MHEHLPKDNGWTVEFLREDDALGRSSVKYKKEDDRYIAEIRLDERERGIEIWITGIVFPINHTSESQSLDATLLAAQKVTGENSQRRAADYFSHLRNRIDQQYFS